MILHPAIVALVFASVLICGMIIFSSWFGIRIIRCWDMQSGSEEQLALERKTYLISTILSYVFVFQIGSLFLFIYTADGLHNLFVGAMCAAGTLYVDPYGYPAFLLKILNCILAGLWLIVNHVDNQARDYPLIRKKYAMLLGLSPLIIAEAVFQWLYFSGMKADVITSCCGSLFNSGQTGVGSEITALPVVSAMAVFYGGIVLTLLSGIIYLVKGKPGYLFSIISGLFFLISCASLISFISLYFYELPTHHCPFCILQKEYGYVGYLLYASLMTGVVSGLGVGVLMPFRRIKSLASGLARFQRRLTLISLVSYCIFAGISICRMVLTDFTMGLF
ncbi:MAG: hypothetical protein CVU71_10145 [Deltaproteobacteria bacterium HGW-Deltaproteobacteria-6]|nr:MAG: hypothetical protein CVU71_10145 [Deltaproteobacteria bacterium HGW-Deltaproteobacteria-6]